MRQLRAWLARFKGLFQKSAREDDLAKEIESHLQLDIDDNIRAGMSPQEAKRVAVMKLGGIDQTKEAYRDRATIPFLESVIQDLRFTLRQLGRNPSVTVAAVLTLAAAIGANTAIFSVVNAVLLRPLPYPNSDRVVSITTTSSLRGLDDLNVSDAEFNEFKAQTRSVEKMAAYASAALNLGDVAQPERIGYAEVSVDLFSALGVSPYLGRAFTPEEDAPGYEPRVVMSYRLWRIHYASDPNIIGKTIQLNGRNRLVIGVMPQGFHFPQDDTDVWMQLNLDPASRILNAKYLNTIALLKPGVSRAEAESEINTVYQRVKQTYPQYYKDETGAGVAVAGLQEKHVKGIRRALLVLLGARFRFADRVRERRQPAARTRCGTTERDGCAIRAWLRAPANFPAAPDGKCAALNYRRRARFIARSLKLARVARRKPARPNASGERQTRSQSTRVYCARHLNCWSALWSRSSAACFEDRFERGAQTEWWPWFAARLPS
jgi:macrolide transport system ATP-binding/permease protein